GNLDEKNREMVITLLMDLKKEYGFTFLMVTHDMSIARLADECIRLNYGVVVNREKRESR
ncbi:MAG: ABC transporter, partial [Spirochaetae bacterium HGW-Spirochaetae-6]